MPRTMTVSDSVLIAADARALYDEISDPSRMGQWSPENRGAEVSEPGRPAYVGMTFVGHNKRGRVRWQTRCTVTAADRGQRFAFDVDRYGLRPPLLPVSVASWEYRFEPSEGGTLVTETWRDGRRNWPDFVADRFDKLATGGRTFAEFQKRNIAKTLARLKQDFESR
jgi:hypothetical protein